MRKGRRIGQYEIAEDRFFNESSERDYLYDDMMDMASELIIGSLGHVSSDVDNWSCLEDISKVKRKSAAAITGTKRSLKCRINKLLDIATDEELIVFIDNYIYQRSMNDTRRFIYNKIEESLQDKLKNLHLDELFSGKNDFVNNITTVYDLKGIILQDDYDTLVNIESIKNDIDSFIKFKENIYITIDQLSCINDYFRYMFKNIIRTIRDSVENIPIDMYNDFKGKIDNIDIPGYCDFIYTTIGKYKWLSLSGSDLFLCKAFSAGTMEIFNKLKPGNLIINDFDIAIVLNKDLTINLIIDSLAHGRYICSEKMYVIYDAIHSILDPEYIGCESGLIEDVYGIEYDKYIVSKAMVKKALICNEFPEAISNYLNNGNMVNMPYLDELFKIKKHEYQILKNDKYFELMEILINIDPMYLISISGKYDFRVFVDLFTNLFKILHCNDKNMTFEVESNTLIYVSLMRYLNRYYEYNNAKELGITNILLHELTYTISIDKFKAICVRLIYSFNTGNSNIVNDDLAIIKKYYYTNK